MSQDSKKTKPRNQTHNSTGLIKVQTTLIIVCITFVFGFIAGVAFTIYKTETRPAAAENDDHDREFQALERKLKDAVDKNSKTAEAWTQLGNFYFDHNQFEKAIQAYSKSAKIEPANPNVLTDLGVMYRRNKQPEKAVEAFNRAMKADPKHETSQFNKGIVLLHDLNDLKGAINAWENLLATNPMAIAPNGKTVDEMVTFYKNKIENE